MNARPPEVKFRNYSMYVEKKYDDDWYEWCVFVDSEPAVLAQVASVEYRLHPTFPEPIRLVVDRDHRFALTSSGWGGFRLSIEVHFTDDRRLTTSHDLHLEADDWPRKQPPARFADAEHDLVYRSLIHQKFRWRKVTTVINATSFQESQVRTLLGQLEHDELVRKAPFRSIDNAELWGATSKVGILPRA